MKNTEIASNRLLRLPLYFDLTIKDVNNISKKIIDFYI